MTETTTTPSAATWWLTAGGIDTAIEKLERINRRAARNGLASTYTWTLGAERKTPVFADDGATMTIGMDLGGEIVLVPHYLEKGQPVPCPLIGWDREQELTVHGEPPRLAGWTFLATLTWDGGVLVTRCTPGFTGLIDDTQIREGECDHCGKSRQRRDCYLVQNDQGDRKQVGSNCIKDFLGHDFRPSWITYGSDLDEVENEARSSFAGTADAPVDLVLTWAAAICGTTGWVSRDKADAQHRASSGQILRGVLFGGAPKAVAEWRRKFAPGPEHAAEAAEVLAWVRGLEPGWQESEYIANVRRAGAAEWAGERNVAILGSAVTAYRREMDLIAEREATVPSEHIGEIKDKITVTVKVTSERVYDSDRFGPAHKFNFITPDGNRIVWMTKAQSLKVGESYELTGIVKGHEVWEDSGIKATVLTRCRYTPAA